MPKLKDLAAVVVVGGIAAFAAVNGVMGLTQGSMIASPKWRAGGRILSGDPSFKSYLAYNLVAAPLLAALAFWKLKKSRPS